MDTMLPVVFVHGAFCTNVVWTEAFEPDLKKRGFFVHCHNLPEHGKAGANPAGASIERYIDDVRAAVEKIAHQFNSPVILGGHSMGGVIVADVARDNPLVTGLALFASAPSAESWMSREAIWKLAMYPSLFGETISIEPHDIEDLFLNDITDQSTLDSLIRDFVPESSRAIRQLAFHRFAIRPSLISTKEVAVFAGAYDRIMTLESQTYLARKFGTKAHIIAAGHMSLLWHPQTRHEFALWAQELSKKVLSKERRLIPAAE